MSKHTPGPWRYDGMTYIWGPNNEMVGETRGTGADLPQDENGKLMAAAPGLLKACVEMHSRHGHEIAGPHDTGSKPDICFLCAAIVEAKGQQSKIDKGE